jgi:hypothetical protein
VLDRRCGGDAVYWKRDGQKTPKNIVRRYQYILLFLALLTTALGLFINGPVAGDFLGPSLDFVFIRVGVGAIQDPT